MSIDMHAHWMPEELHDALGARGKAPGESVAVQARLASMDEHGYTHGVLSLTPGSVEGHSDEDTLDLCRIFNDATSAACHAYPDRFSGFAALPTFDLEVMIEEFERVSDLPGMVGAVLPGDGFLSLRRAEKFAPLFRAANERRAIFLVHYGRLANDPESRLKELTDNTILRRGTLDMQSRLSENMLTFCFTDFLADYPNVTVVSHNLGGNIAFEAERMDHRTFTQRPGEELPSRVLRQAPVLVDCNSFGSNAIELAVKVYGADKIVCGSDGTSFGMSWTNQALTNANISQDEKNLIHEGNARAALARVNPTLSAG